jgi:hypothetical protein
MIAMGSPTVLIGNLMAARMGDPTVHGGVIVIGCPTVIIGEVGMGSPVEGGGFEASLSEAEVIPQIAALVEAAISGAPFGPIC